jgi:hypothetical protein
MKRRSGRSSARTDKADDGSGITPFSRERRQSREMGISRAAMVGMGNFHHIGVTASLAGKDDHAISRGNDRRAPRGGYVDPPVKSHVMIDRIRAYTKGRGYRR